jgi:ABC-type lipoprotein export system ATPase subunit
MGLTVPEGETPTDYYLQVTDSTAPESQSRDFIQAYRSSAIGKKHAAIVDDALKGASTAPAKLEYHATQWQQFVTLLSRNLTVARRDPTLYYLQLFLHSFYGFLVGAVFWSLDPFAIGARLNDAFNGITWLAFISTYIHVFKTHYLVVSNARFHHEHQNRAYAALPYWGAELIATCIGTAAFLPGVTICYFMMGLPTESFGFTFLVLYILCLAAEGSVHFVTQFFKSASYAVVAAQCFMVILCVFATGSLIRPENVPTGWVWLQEVSYYFWGTHAMALEIFSDITYTCANDGFAVFDAVAETCSVPLLGLEVPCDAGVSGGVCSVEGRTFLDAYKGIDGPDKWDAFGKLVGITIGFRLLVLALYYVPVGVMYSTVASWLFVSKAKMERLTAIAAQRGQDTVVSLEEVETAAATAGAPASSSARDMNGGPASQLVWQNLSLTLANGKILIDNVTGAAIGGRVLSLMGPSGAGKTTLLNALCGRATYARVQGDVLFNGRPMTRNDLDFVPQFDDLNDYFTVGEALTYTARFKRRETDTEASIAERVTKLLGILGLEKQRNMRPAQLTGGQRKRVSIGVGLVAEPAILFLDEPTTVSRFGDGRK